MPLPSRRFLSFLVVALPCLLAGCPEPQLETDCVDSVDGVDQTTCPSLDEAAAIFDRRNEDSCVSYDEVVRAMGRNNLGGCCYEVVVDDDTCEADVGFVPPR